MTDCPSHEPWLGNKLDLNHQHQDDDVWLQLNMLHGFLLVQGSTGRSVWSDNGTVSIMVSGPELGLGLNIF